MPVRFRTLAVLLAVAGVVDMAAAQPLPPANAPDCQAQVASLNLDIEAARAKGQMLRHRQLSDQRAALSLRCPASAPPATRAEQIRGLEQQVRQLKGELERTEAELARLRKAP
jgi:hypothetical protein